MAQITTTLACVRDGYGATNDIKQIENYVNQEMDDETEEVKEFWIEFYCRLDEAWEDYANKILEPYGAYVVGDKIYGPHPTSPDYADYEPFPEDDSEELEELEEWIYDEWDQDLVIFQQKIYDEMTSD
ncbi:hypothetical protein ACU19_09540 [Actinobaculum suis]|nr:hypothetical protein ACU19_09540 [Actinobaculum suis]